MSFSTVNSTVTLENTINNLVNSQNAFNISYTGSYINKSVNSSLFGSSNSREFINSSVAKYGNAFMIFFNTTSRLTSPTYIIQNRNNLSYCTAFYGISCFSYLVNFTPSQYISYNYLDSIIYGSLNDTNKLILPATPINDVLTSITKKVKYLGQSTYDGNNCSNVAYSINASINNTYLTGELNGSSVLCYSDVFGLPLSGYVKFFANLTEYGANEYENSTSIIVSHINKATTSYKQVNISSLYNPTQISVNGSSCGNFTLSLSNYPSHVYGLCSWNGGNINISYGSGNAGYASVSIVGQKIIRHTLVIVQLLAVYLQELLRIQFIYPHRIIL